VQQNLAKLKAAAYQKPVKKKLGSSENLLQSMVLLAHLEQALLSLLERALVGRRPDLSQADGGDGPPRLTS
jgi:hypothetical protein